MNERILDLAVKSRHIVGELPLNVNEKIQLAGLEKFAELIIRECIEQVRDNYLSVLEDKEMMKDPQWNWYVQCGVESVVSIKSHFEIEK